MRTELYRHFDADGVLLYVGISVCSMARLAGHSSSSEWYPLIRTITIERFATRQEAEDAEYEAIVRECPLHNKAMKNSPYRTAAERRAIRAMLAEGDKQTERYWEDVRAGRREHETLRDALYREQRNAVWENLADKWRKGKDRCTEEA